MRNSTTQPRGLRAALIAGGLALVLTTAACGSDATPAASATSTPAAAASPSSEAMTTGSSSSASVGSSGSVAPSSSGDAQASVALSGPAPTALTADEISAAKATLGDASKLTVCTSLPYAPFEAQGSDGTITGFDIDFMNAAAKVLGVSTNVIQNDFTGIQSGQAMTAKTCDVGAAAMTITPERAANLTFSDPYYDASQGLMVMADSGITDISGLKGKKIVTQTGTTGDKYAQERVGEWGVTILNVKTIADEGQSLQSGNVDGAIQDLPALKQYEKDQKGTVKVIQSFNTGEQYGFGVAKGNDALAKVFNFAIAQMQSDGGYQASYEKWIDPGQS